ncbi:MAG: Ribonucleoside-diphosphate reductase [Microgenomates group bacterium GW2011_GWF2_45_18]|nr:MAG: Ribonucleoside-diphosphate reductase [Microgenomates group bacterium GW2011_GWF1_44_10]KKU01605.1 MAG: Ribonucleoside-diphosphate reductase [Microgenomates group bacterium GW2011_GWF2_45_18]HAU99514.1 adenosylcobalamin-dependent ribonucleoside-diphosphate reductase [Candidatus Paceibacterota bacterium]HAX01324.1 adenosylcobalamin-dependent ribonucleoside-diphosphate reductase [Candidatus Paceibacterota bacterium]
MKTLPTNAQEVMIKRYALRDDQGKPVETVQDILKRASHIVAQAEHQYRDGQTPEQVEEKFVSLLEDFRFMPNGRTLANAGTGWGQLANCFVLPIDDDMGRSQDGIFNTLRNAVLVLQSGGGVGFSFGRIRPKGDSIGAGKGKATGVVSFLKIYDTAFWVIGQGGGRRSACMAVLPVHHPDIREFIRCKEKEGTIEHFNISVGLTDAFMQAVESNALFPLINPRNGEVWEKVRARELFEEIIQFAHRNGEPGVLFLDAANRENPTPSQGALEATNPCGEQFLLPFENCCMASINIAEHVKNGKKSLFAYAIDWEKLQETTEWVVRWLDDVVDTNKYVSAVPQLEEAAKRNRRIGVSIMGLADVLYKVGVRYGSKKGVDLAGQIMEFIRFHTLKTSVQLARERGAFPGIKGSRYDFTTANIESMKGKGIKAWEQPKPLRSYSSSFGQPKLDWKALTKEIRTYGVRNSCQNTIQPTGAIATITGLEGYGCEPVFALSYVMRTHEGAEELGQDFRELSYESESFRTMLARAGVSKKKREEIFALIREKGSCQSIQDVPKELRDVFVVSSDVSVDEHLEMQAALQRFVDNAISKTINFPANASVKDVEKAYFTGWKHGLKGMTVYVTGSRNQVVLETGETKKSREESKVQTTTKSEGKKLDVHYENDQEQFVGSPLVKVKPGEERCPECSTTLVIQEGCFTCPSCAYSKCSV